MGTEFLFMFIKIVVFLPFILFIVYLSLKYGGIKLQNIQNGRYIKIMERVPLSKENQLIVVKIGVKGYVITSVNGKIDILFEVDKQDLESIEASRRIPEYKSLRDMYERLRSKREEKNE